MNITPISKKSQSKAKQLRLVAITMDPIPMVILTSGDIYSIDEMGVSHPAYQKLPPEDIAQIAMGYAGYIMKCQVRQVLASRQCYGRVT